jgi:hypothetical protein
MAIMQWSPRDTRIINMIPKGPTRIYYHYYCHQSFHHLYTLLEAGCKAAPAPAAKTTTSARNFIVDF